MENNLLQQIAKQTRKIFLLEQTPFPSLSIPSKTNFCFRFTNNRLVRDETNLTKSSLLCKNTHVLSLNGDCGSFGRGVKRKLFHIFFNR